jgi:exosortase E/protease (VPEID-CTERM system)
MSTPLTDAGVGSERRVNLALRALIGAAVLGVEKSALNVLVDHPGATAAVGLGAMVRDAQHLGFRFAVTCAIALALFTYLRADERFARVNAEGARAPLRVGWLVIHALLVIATAPLVFSLYGGHGLALPFWGTITLTCLLALGAVLALLAALAPAQLWWRGASALRPLWGYAALAGAGAAAALQFSQTLWRPTASLTFQLVYNLLKPLIPGLGADTSSLTLLSDSFSVHISDQCSGLEGAGLMLAFTVAWLAYFRHEYVFPRALVLIPIGLALSFALNVVRIAVLMMIGCSGFPDVAVYGFHSQAGWIMFNLAAGVVALVSRRSSWLNRTARQAAHAGELENPTAAYLAPLLLILAVGMLARAMSGGFDTWYGLRLIAGALAIARYWPRLSRLDWRASWRGISVGVVMFAVWIMAAHWLLQPQPMPPALAAMSAPLRTLWIATRVAASVITVPIAEELAYRAYLQRRLLAADFEAVPFAASLGWPLLVSSVLFGATHAALWGPAIVAGLAYGAVLARTGRIGEAVAAHAATNALLCVTVLVGGQWQLW